VTSSVLVTGATGYLGRHLLGALQRQNQPALALVRKLSDWQSLPWSNEVEQVVPVEGSPLAPRAWRDAPQLSNVRTIIHAAGVVRHSRNDAREVDEMNEVNVRGTLRMVQAAKALKARMVFVSSSGTVGCFRFPDLAADEDAPFAEELAGRWPYYASKIRAEREARRLAERIGVELVIVRPPVMLGPDDHKMRSVGHVLRVLDGKLPAVPQGGMHFTDVRDAASAIARIPTLDVARPIYHLPGTASTLAEFFRMVNEVSGTKAVSRSIPRWTTRGLAKVSALASKRPKWLPDPVILEMSTRFWGLTSLFAHELGYAPRPARQTLADTVAWLRSVKTEHAHSDSRVTISVNVPAS